MYEDLEAMHPHELLALRGASLRLLGPDPVRRMVILGAGTSVEAGIPATAGLHAMLLADDRLPLYEAISDCLFSDVASPDVERVVRLLEHLADPYDLESDLRRIGYRLSEDLLGHELAGDMRNGAYSKPSQELIIIRDFLRDIMWVPPSSPGYRSAYLVPLLTAQHGSSVATLNYDNCLDLDHRTVSVRHETHRVLVPEENEEYTRSLKLHGSIDWRQNQNDVTWGADPHGALNYKPGIIFGAGNKLRHYGPFLDLLRAFTDCLTRSEALVVLGYGWRDPHINEAIRVWAESPLLDVTKQLVVGLGPDNHSMPALVEPWYVLDHLEITGIPGTAAEVILQLFGPLIVDESNLQESWIDLITWIRHVMPHSTFPGE